MSFTDLIWLFFVLSTLTPVMQQRLIERQRAWMLNKLQRERGSRVIAMIHRQETISFLGIPVARYIDINDSEEVLRAIHLTADDVPIDLVLHTPGGLVLAASQIAQALARHKAPVRVLVPHYAMSGGTLIALAADEVIMDPNAVLGPVTPNWASTPPPRWWRCSMPSRARTSRIKRSSWRMSVAKRSRRSTPWSGKFSAATG